MKSALEVARYFLCRVDREAGDTISVLKLQKLVYYVVFFDYTFALMTLTKADIQEMSAPVSL